MRESDGKKSSIGIIRINTILMKPATMEKSSAKHKRSLLEKEGLPTRSKGLLPTRGNPKKRKISKKPPEGNESQTGKRAQHKRRRSSHRPTWKIHSKVAGLDSMASKLSPPTKPRRATTIKSTEMITRSLYRSPNQDSHTLRSKLNKRTSISRVRNSRPRRLLKTRLST